MRKSRVGGALALGAIALAMALFALSTQVGPIARAEQTSLDCPVTFTTLQSELEDAAEADSTGLNNHYWAVVVNREGAVCAVAYSGRDRDSQWLLSRQIAAAKAFTANGLSLDNAPISTAQLYPWVQPGAPGNPLFGLAGGNPVSPEAAYRGCIPAVRNPQRSDGRPACRRNDHVRRRARPLLERRCGRRPRPVWRHGVCGSFDRLATESGAPFGAGSAERHHHAQQHHGTSALPERRRNAGGDALSSAGFARRSGHGRWSNRDETALR